MGKYLQRTRMETAPQSEELSAPLLPEGQEADLLDNPVMARAGIAISYMMSKGSSGNRKPVMKIVAKIVREALVDASEVPPPIAEFYMKQLSAMIWWVACGEQSAEIPLPGDFSV